MKKIMVSRYASVLFGILVAGCSGEAADESRVDEMEGAWELVAYELNGRDVPVSGVLVFSGGAFGMIYAMGSGQDAQAGRAHTGTYRVRDGEVMFDVELWVQKAEESTGVVPGKSVRAGLERRGERAILHFEGGSVQELRPLEPVGEPFAPGSWTLRSGEAPRPKSRRGSLVTIENRYVLLHQDMASGSGKAYGGTISGDGHARAEWAISVADESGTVVAGGERRPSVDFATAGDILQFRDDSGDPLTFSRR